MSGCTADERQALVVPLQEPILEHRDQEMASLPIPDELMAEIFLRLPTPADLARASATCISFRRLTADRSFLRRYRKLHAPPILGFLEYESKVFHPAIAPHPSASAASAVALAADLSFSFLPAPASHWVIHDIRDGRVLLYRFCHHGTNVFPELVACDPLHRRYLLLPPINNGPLLKETKVFTDIFFVRPGDGDKAAAAEETSFRVAWLVMSKTSLVVFVFSSNTRQWQAIPSQCWSDLFAGLPPLGVMNLSYWREYVYGCFYFVIDYREEIKLLVLNAETMEFSVAEPPPDANGSCGLAMVEAGEGRPGMFVLADDSDDLCYFIRQNDGDRSSQWKKVKTISLGSGTNLVCEMEKSLLLYQPQSSLLEAGGFMLDIETFQLEKVCALGSSFDRLHAYSNFPPSLLSSPTISSGVENRAENEMLEQGFSASSSAESPRSRVVPMQMLEVRKRIRNAGRMLCKLTIKPLSWSVGGCFGSG